MTESNTMTESNNTEATKKYLRNVSLWSVEQLEKMGLSLFFDRDAELTEAEQNDQVVALIFVHHEDYSEDAVERLVESGEWRAEVKKFKRAPQALWAMPEVVPVIQRVRDIMGQKGFLAAADADASEE